MSILARCHGGTRESMRSSNIRPQKYFIAWKRSLKSLRENTVPRTLQKTAHIEENRKVAASENILANDSSKLFFESILTPILEWNISKLVVPLVAGQFIAAQ